MAARISVLSVRRALIGRILSGLHVALQHLVLHAEALPFGRKAAVAHVGGIAGDGVFDRRAGFRVALDEARRKAGKQADQVMEYENLTVAMRACADADGRDGNALGDQARERRRHQLQHHPPAAGALERLRAFQDAPRVLLVLALQLVAAERRRGLRSETDVPRTGTPARASASMIGTTSTPPSS